MKNLIVFVFLFASPYAMAVDRVPVTVGGNGDLSACPSTGIIKAADGVGGAHIRTGPSEQHLIFGFVGDGEKVWVCGREGDWIGIVYPSKGESCEVSEPINPAQPYQGECKSGWLHQSDIRSGDVQAKAL